MDLSEGNEGKGSLKEGRPQTGFRLSLSLKISILVSTVVFLFLAASYLNYDTMRDFSHDMEKAQYLLSASSDIASINAIDRGQFELFLDMDSATGSVDETLAAIADQRELMDRSRAALVYVSGGFNAMENLRETTDEIEGLIRNEISPAQAAGDQQRLAALSVQLKRLHERQEAESVELGNLILAEFNEWESGHQEAIDSAGLLLLSTTGVATLTALSLGMVVSGRFRRRINSLTSVQDEVAAGDLGSRVMITGSDELTDLAASFNKMTAALEKNATQLRLEKNQIRSTYQAVTDGIVVYDKSGKIQSVNPAAEAALGVLEKNLAGFFLTGIPELDKVTNVPDLVPAEDKVKCWQEKNCTHPDCPAFESQDLRCWLQCGTHCYNEIQGTFAQKRDACERCDVYMKNGVRSIEFENEGRVFSAIVSPILDQHGQEEGRMVVLHDINEVRKVEDILRSRNSELMVFNEIAASLSQSFEDVDLILNEALAKVTHTVGSSAGVIAVAESGKDNVQIKASVGLSPQTCLFLGLLPASTITELTADREDRLPVQGAVLNSWKSVGPLLKREGLNNPVIIPLENDGRVHGVLAVADEVKTDYGDDDIRMLKTSAMQIGVAIQNAELFKNVNRAKKTWETTFDSMSDGIYVLDTDQNIIMANRAMADLLGTRVQSLAGRKCYEATHGASAPIAGCPFKGALESGEVGSIETEETGLGMTFRICVNPIHDENGAVVGMVHVMSDVTEKNKLRTQLIQTEKMAAVGQLVSGVAHELNNPLTGVMGYSQLLLNKYKGKDSKTAGDLEAIIYETERASGIVQNLLSFARKQQPRKEMIDINSAIENILKLREYEFIQKDILVKTRFENGLPSTMADLQQIEQVLLNIVNNAEQAVNEVGRQGKISICTGYDDKFLTVSVTDNGKGIDQGDLQRIFDPFYTTREIGKGKGLGLSICYGIVEEHGGDFSAESLPGDGTTITFKLPIVTQPVKDKKGQPEAGKAELQRRVLLVDDEPAIVELLSDILTMEGHGVDVAENCSVALKKLACGSYDNVITDVSVIGIEGRELYRRIREIDPELAANVVFIIDDLESHDDREYINQTGNSFLVKPFDLQDLRQELKKVMKDNGR